MKYYTPRGTEIVEYDKFVCSFIPKTNGWLTTREKFLQCVEDGDFYPHDDGTLSEIIIDGQLTCYELAGWAMEFYLGFDESGRKIYFGTLGDSCYRIKLISMEEFKALEGNVQVCWYNK